MLRIHPPVAFNVYRKTTTGDALPLYNPVTMVSGEVVTEVPVPKGLNVVVSIAASNRQTPRLIPPSGSLKPFVYV